MFKTLFWIVLLLVVFAVWQKRETKARVKQPLVDGPALVVNYWNTEDLLVQLKNVKAGQKIEPRWIGSPTTPAYLKFDCSERASANAYRDRMNREAAELCAAVDKEFKRIAQGP